VKQEVAAEGVALLYEMGLKRVECKSNKLAVVGVKKKKKT